MEGDCSIGYLQFVNAPRRPASARERCLGWTATRGVKEGGRDIELRCCDILSDRGNIIGTVRMPYFLRFAAVSRFLPVDYDFVVLTSSSQVYTSKYWYIFCVSSQISYSMYGMYSIDRI